jgi:hypothetical protein
MKKTYLLFSFFLSFFSAIAQNSSTNSGGQVVTAQPTILVIPFTKKDQDIRTVLEADPIKRIVIAKVREAFDKRGFTTYDFVTKLNNAKEQNLLTSTNQSDIKSQLVTFAGADIYVEVDVNPKKDGIYNGIDLILTGNESSTGNALSNKVGNSGTFQTDDYGVLATKAIDKISTEFLETMQAKFTDMVENGRDILLNISFAQGSTVNGETEIASAGLPFSDVVDEWISKNAYKNNYHLQGTVGSSIIYDRVRIPLKDQATKQNYSANKFALEIFKYLKSIGITSSKDTKGNTIYITIK